MEDIQNWYEIDCLFDEDAKEAMRKFSERHNPKFKKDLEKKDKIHQMIFASIYIELAQHIVDFFWSTDIEVYEKIKESRKEIKCKVSTTFLYEKMMMLKPDNMRISVKVNPKKVFENVLQESVYIKAAMHHKKVHFVLHEENPDYFQYKVVRKNKRKREEDQHPRKKAKTL